MPDDPTLPPSPSPGPETTSGLAPNVGAGIACIFAPVSSIIMLVIEKKNEFIRYWAAQSTVFGGIWFVAGIAIYIISTILTAIHLGFLAVLLSLAWMVVCLGLLVVWVITLIKSFGGQKWDIPIVSNYIPMVLGWFKN